MTQGLSWCSKRRQRSILFLTSFLVILLIVIFCEIAPSLTIGRQTQDEELLNAPSIVHSRHKTRPSSQHDPNICNQEYASGYELTFPNPIQAVDDTLSQTICHPQGRFRTTTPDVWNASDPVLVQEWELKLIYLAIHDLSHRPSKKEDFLQNGQTGCPTSNNQSQPNEVAYFQHQHCANSKYLVTNLKDIGLGASLRQNAVAHILAAIVTERIPIFVNNARGGPSFLQSPWKLASCQSQDMHCVFQPMSPCSSWLSSSILENATLVPEISTRRLLRQGKLSPKFVDIQVLVLESRLSSPKLDKLDDVDSKVRRRVHNRVAYIVEEWWNSTQQTAKDHQRWMVLKAATERILVQDRPPRGFKSYEYGHKWYQIAHAATLYVLRPNQATSQAIKEHMNRIFRDEELNPGFTVGMPIRGSDKCDSESTCLPFSKYMKLANATAAVWRNAQSPRFGDKKGSVIVTTEDETVLALRHYYNNASTFPLHITVNENDSLQSTGSVSTYGAMADDIMRSTLIALQMQMRAGYVYGNCCSNFHQLLFDLLYLGCGVATPNLTCLQDTSEYNICCQWTKSKECEDIREYYGKKKAGEG